MRWSWLSLFLILLSKIRKIRQTCNSICFSLLCSSLIWFWASWNLVFNCKTKQKKEKRKEKMYEVIGHFTTIWSQTCQCYIRRQAMNKGSACTSQFSTKLWARVKSTEDATHSKREVPPRGEWNMRADWKRQLKVPYGIVVTSWQVDGCSPLPAGLSTRKRTWKATVARSAKGHIVHFIFMWVDTS